jgi:hypothetical protein
MMIEEMATALKTLPESRCTCIDPAMRAILGGMKLWAGVRENEWFSYQAVRT